MASERAGRRGHGEAERHKHTETAGREREEEIEGACKTHTAVPTVPHVGPFIILDSSKTIDNGRDSVDLCVL